MKILITYASAGAGHRRAAEAIYDYLKLHRPQFNVELRDILTRCSPLFKFSYKAGYDFLVRYAPSLWGFFFWFTSFKPCRKIIRKASSLTNWINCLRFTEYLAENDFDYIISTHFLTSELAAKLKSKNKIRAKLITVITDFGVHPFWVSVNTDCYIVASGLTRIKLLSLGVESKKIKNFGIPFSSKFTNNFDRVELAAKFGIEADKFTVLLMTGSFGNGPLEEIAANLCKEVQVLLVCARNKKLFSKMTKRNLSNVRVFGFINNPEELMAASDLIITKPGGSTIAELINMELVPIFISAIPGQELENARVLAEYGVGSQISNAIEIKEEVLELKNNSRRLESLREALRRLKRPQVCSGIANVIC